MRSPLLPHDLTVPEPGSTTTRALFARAVARVMHEAPGLLSEAAREAGASGFRVGRGDRA